MAKKLLIKTPQTSDGTNLLYDENKQVIVKESYAEPKSKTHFESLNAKTPKHLQSEISEVYVEFDKLGNVIKPKAASPNKSTGNSPAQKENADVIIEKIKAAKTQKEVDDLIKDEERKTVLDAATKKGEEFK